MRPQFCEPHFVLLLVTNSHTWHVPIYSIYSSTRWNLGFSVSYQSMWCFVAPNLTIPCWLAWVVDVSRIWTPQHPWAPHLGFKSHCFVWIYLMHLFVDRPKFELPNITKFDYLTIRARVFFDPRQVGNPGPTLSDLDKPCQDAFAPRNSGRVGAPRSNCKVFRHGCGWKWWIFPQIMGILGVVMNRDEPWWTHRSF
jgi:hypothetical protein